MADDIIRILAKRLADARAVAEDVSKVVLEVSEDEYFALKGYAPPLRLGDPGLGDPLGQFVSATASAKQFLGVPLRVTTGRRSQERQREQEAAVEELLGIAAGLEG